MKKQPSARRRPAVNISLGRASRLYRLVSLLAVQPLDRDTLLAGLAIGLRTFYRELDLLRRCAIKIQRVGHAYTLKMTPADAQGRLPFPDPLLSFAEMSELAQQDSPASRRLATLLESVVNPPPPAPKKSKPRKPK